MENKRMSDWGKEIFKHDRIMTVGELIAKLQKFPNDWDVYLMGFDDNTAVLQVEDEEIAESCP